MSARHRPLPPYGAAWQALRRSAAYLGQPCRVAIGPGAWTLATHSRIPIMVLPAQSDPFAFAWPVRGEAVLLVELGIFDTDAMERLAVALLDAGAQIVIPIRDALLAERPPKMWPRYIPDDKVARHG